MHKKDLRKEQILVRNAKKDKEAFGELYDIYFPKIFAYISWRVGNKDDAEDLVSLVFNKVLNKLDSFQWQKGATFSSWIFRVAYNTLTDYYRANNKKNVNIEDLPDIESDEILPNEDLDRKLLFKKLQSMIKQLPKQQAEIITMRFFSEMKNKEIAQVLQIKERSVSSGLCRGLKTLHIFYNKQ
jgi:RNA polymerase sigma-70 factor (ECF subfamily)